MNRSSTAGIVTLVLSCVSAGAQQAPSDMVKARQAAMDDFWPKHYQQLVQGARAQTVDLAKIADDARSAAQAVRAVTGLFPPGTGRDTIATTRAKPEVWSDRAEFEKNLATLANETEAIAKEAATGNVDAVRAQVTKAAQACGACHSGKPKEGGKFRFDAPS